MEINPRTFLQFISGNPSLASLTLAHCSFPEHWDLPSVIPVKLSRLKILRLTNIDESPSFPCLIEIPTLGTLSSLHILALPREGYRHYYDFRVCARSDDGFQLSIDIPELFDDQWVEDKLVTNWLGITRSADPHLAFVRLENRDLDPQKDYEPIVSPLPLFANTTVRWVRYLTSASPLTTLQAPPYHPGIIPTQHCCPLDPPHHTTDQEKEKEGKDRKDRNKF